MLIKGHKLSVIGGISSRDLLYNMVTVVNSSVSYTEKVAKRVDL